MAYAQPKLIASKSAKLSEFKPSETEAKIEKPKSIMNRINTDFMVDEESGRRYLQFTVPLDFEMSQVNSRTDTVEGEDGKPLEVHKANAICSAPIPEGLELSVFDAETGETTWYRVKRGGLLANHLFILNIDPAKGFRRPEHPGFFQQPEVPQDEQPAEMEATE